MYFVNEEDEVIVLSANPEKFEFLSQTSLGGEPMCSLIAIAEGRFFVRTSESLYGVGK